MTARLRRLPFAPLRVAAHRARFARVEPRFQVDPASLAPTVVPVDAVGPASRLAGFQSGRPLHQIRKNPACAGLFRIWRRGRDSNPRKATNLQRFSRPPHSTALPPLLNRLAEQLAEREGFEPSVRFNPYTHFPGEPVRPLRHLSAETCSDCTPRVRGTSLLAIPWDREREGLTTRLRRLPSASLRVVPTALRPSHRARLTPRFEPSVRGNRTLTFQASPFDHSGTSPQKLVQIVRPVLFGLLDTIRQNCAKPDIVSRLQARGKGRAKECA